MANREILLSLLKQLLVEKLQPLEKRNTNEIKDLGTLAVSMKTIEKNVKASCDMTNRIIEKMKQKAEEEKKKNQNMCKTLGVVSGLVFCIILF